MIYTYGASHIIMYTPYVVLQVNLLKIELDKLFSCYLSCNILQ